MQELIARLCGRHFSELQNHYSHSYSQRDEEGMVIGLSDSEQDPMCTHLALRPLEAGPMETLDSEVSPGPVWRVL
jgi:hypothetical protein